MRRCFALMLLLLLPLLTSAQVKSGTAGDSTNLALSATVTTSYISTWEKLAAVWLEIWSMKGIIMNSEKLTGDTSVRLTEKMSPGIYFAVFKAREGRSVHKIIVK